MRPNWFAAANSMNANAEAITATHARNGRGAARSERFGGTSDDIAYGVALDGSGNVVIVGQFQNTVDFGGGALTSAGDRDIFVAKYSPSGAYLWARRYGSTSRRTALTTVARRRVLGTRSVLIPAIVVINPSRAGASSRSDTVPARCALRIAASAAWTASCSS